MVDVSDTTSITGPFSFEPISSTNDKISKFNRNACKICHTTCIHRNMLPLTPGYRTSHQPSIQKLSKTRKRKSSSN